MKSKITAVSTCLLLATSLFIQALWPKRVVSLLISNLPFRQAYQPNVIGLLFVYALPLMLGYLLSRLFYSSKIRSSVYFINISLIVGATNALPLLYYGASISSYWFDTNVIGYNAILFPVLLLVGSLPTLFKLDANKPGQRATAQAYVIQPLDWVIAGIFGLTSFTLNLIPAALSHYLVGADVYYHAAKTQTIINGESIFTNPYFLHEKNYYYSIVYYVLAGVHKLTSVGVVTLWRYYVPFSAALCVFVFYLIAKKIGGSKVTAVMAAIFVGLINQFLWVDPSVRTMAYVFFSLSFLCTAQFLYSRRVRYLCFALLFWVLTMASHPEVALHAALVAGVFVFLSFGPTQRFILTIYKRLAQENLEDNFYIPKFDTARIYLVLLSLFLFLSTYYVFFALGHYNVQQFLIFNEIPLSIFQPLGVVSFLVFLFGITAIPGLLRQIKRGYARLLLAIVSLASVVIFYFIHVWTLYHRYFLETAYFALAIVAAIGLSKVLSELERKDVKKMLAVLVGFVAVSIVPKLTFIYDYSRATQSALDARQPDFNLVKAATLPNDIILANPSDIINRYLPIYAQRRIFAGSSILTVSQQWQVLSFCNGVYQKTCDARDQLASAFYNSPSKDTLGKIEESYQVNDFMVSKDIPGELEKFNTSFTASYTLLGQDNHYILYRIGG